MISDNELIDMIRNAATDRLPIAVMSLDEMRQFAELVALDCLSIVEMNSGSKMHIIRKIRDRYEITQH